MTTRTAVDPSDLEAMRKLAGLTQAEMAAMMHISVRSYEELSSGRTQPRPIHRRAAEMGFLALARKRGDASFLPDHMKELVRDVVALIDKPAA